MHKGTGIYPVPLRVWGITTFECMFYITHQLNDEHNDIFCLDLSQVLIGDIRKHVLEQFIDLWSALTYQIKHDLR